MSVPKSNIWQELRVSCLDAVPSGSRPDSKNRTSLGIWQRNGHYIVQAATTKRFQLIASSDDLGTALLTDAECLLDSAAEHQVSLWRHIHSEEWLSPAWLGVTFYYWSFYLALAITRLTGRTAWFLTKEIARDFKRLTPAPASTPGAGCFRLVCGSSVSATEREVFLEKVDGRVHEEVWRIWFGACACWVRLLTIGSSGSLEERLYTALARSGQKLGEDWPSVFRNAINYRAGFAYGAVRRENLLNSLGYLRRPHSYGIESLIDRLERILVRVRTSASILLAPQIVLEMLVDVTFLLHALTTELHADLLNRHGLDNRWSMKRQRFLIENGLKTHDGLWPL